MIHYHRINKDLKNTGKIVLKMNISIEIRNCDASTIKEKYFISYYTVEVAQLSFTLIYVSHERFDTFNLEILLLIELPKLIYLLCVINSLFSYKFFNTHSSKKCGLSSNFFQVFNSN